jgi:tetratricopeptide (TPR) repeat protein
VFDPNFIKASIFQSQEKVKYDKNSLRAIRLAGARKWILIALISLVLLATVLGFYFYKKQKNENANIIEEYVSIEAISNKEIAKFREEIMKMKSFNFQKLNPDHKVSAEKFFDFAKKYPTHPLAWQAAYKAANYYSKNDKIQEAIVALTLVWKNARKENLLRTRTAYSLASYHFKLGEKEKALTVLKEAILREKSNDVMNLSLMLLQAQILYSSGQKGDSKKVLEEIIASALTQDTENTAASKVQEEAKKWLNYWNFND